MRQSRPCNRFVSETYISVAPRPTTQTCTADNSRMPEMSIPRCFTSRYFRGLPALNLHDRIKLSPELNHVLSMQVFLYSVRHPRGLRLRTVGRSWEFQSGRTNSVSHERTNEPTMRVFSIPTTLLCRACVIRKVSARNLDAPRRRSASVKTTQERGKRQQKMNHAKNDVQMMNERVPRHVTPALCYDATPLTLNLSSKL